MRHNPPLEFAPFGGWDLRRAPQLHVDAVEKPFFAPNFSTWNILVPTSNTGCDFYCGERENNVRRGGKAAGVAEAPYRSLLRVPVMRQFLDVVHQAVELPLRIHLRFSSEREAVELFVVPQIAEDGFHGGETPAILDASFRVSMRAFILSV